MSVPLERLVSLPGPFQSARTVRVVSHYDHPLSISDPVIRASAE